MLKLKKYPYSDILGWSVSRYDKFKICQRQYYYDYYAKKYDIQVDKTQLLRLRELTSVALEVGNIFHDVVKAILERLVKDPKPLDRNKLNVWAKNLAIEYCSKKEFFEIFYKQTETIDKEDIGNRVLGYVNHLLESQRFKWILDNALAQSSNWMIEPGGYGETRINELKAYCKVDFLFPLDDKIYIIDWKTGKEDEEKHRIQLMGYSAFACNHFEKKAEDIICILYFLKDEREKFVTFTSEEIRNFSETLTEQSQEMYNLTKDVKNNIPKLKEDFQKTIHSRICDFCNYRDICLGKDLPF
jgi:ATP-dependent helicase/DNAse subunit B